MSKVSPEEALLELSDGCSSQNKRKLKAETGKDLEKYCPGEIHCFIQQNQSCL